MKRILILTLSLAMAGCATAPARSASSCNQGGAAAGAGHMIASGNAGVMLLGAAVAGLAALSCPVKS